MAKRWKKEDETYLKRYAKGRKLEELAQRFRTDSDTVQTKLTEMRLAAKDSIARISLQDDPLVPEYATALKALHQKKWRVAKGHLQKVLAETDRPELAERARRFLAVCVQQLAGDPKSARDPFLQAVYERNRGNFAEALSLCAAGGRQAKDERFAYLAAALNALTGELEKASQLLTASIELNPKNRIHAFHDSDFAELKDSQDYGHIFIDV